MVSNLRKQIRSERRTSRGRAAEVMCGDYEPRLWIQSTGFK